MTLEKSKEADLRERSPQSPTHTPCPDPTLTLEVARKALKMLTNFMMLKETQMGRSFATNMYRYIHPSAVKRANTLTKSKKLVFV